MSVDLKYSGTARNSYFLLMINLLIMNLLIFTVRKNDNCNSLKLLWFYDEKQHVCIFEFLKHPNIRCGSWAWKISQLTEDFLLVNPELLTPCQFVKHDPACLKTCVFNHKWVIFLQVFTLWKHQRVHTHLQNTGFNMSMTWILFNKMVSYLMKSTTSSSLKVNFHFAHRFEMHVNLARGILKQFSFFSLTSRFIARCSCCQLSHLPLHCAHWQGTGWRVWRQT